MEESPRWGAGKGWFLDLLLTQFSHCHEAAGSLYFLLFRNGDLLTLLWLSPAQKDKIRLPYHTLLPFPNFLTFLFPLPSPNVFLHSFLSVCHISFVSTES